MTTGAKRGVGRRAMVAGSVALAGLGLAGEAASAPASPVRLSLTSFAADRELVGALRRAVFEMKAKDPVDPSSWWWQGAVHRLTEALVPTFPGERKKPEPSERTRYWNQCPHGMGEEGADEFLGWHAAYLLHFEEVIRAVSGLDRLRLPYWDYTNPTQRRLPALFVSPQIRVNARWEDDAQGVLKDNPLYESLRGELNNGKASIAASAVDISWFPKVQEFRGVTSVLGGMGFGGRGKGQLGLFEKVPHGQVHNAIGGLMGSTHSAAFDPIFWVHHANVDRLWRQWLATGTRNWGGFSGQADLDAWLNKRAWPFKRADGQEVWRPRRDDTLMALTTVRYESEARVPKDPVLRTAPTPGPSASIMSIDPAIQSFSTVASVAQTTEAVVVRGRENSSVTLTTGPVSLGGGGQSSVRTSLMSATAAAPKRLLLDISGLSTEGSGALGYEVYVNPHGTDGLNRSSPSFVGVLQLFGALESEQHAGHIGGDVQSFDASAAALAADVAQPQLTVVLKPFDLIEGGTAATSATLTVKSLSLRVVEGSSLPDR